MANSRLQVPAETDLDVGELLALRLARAPFPRVSNVVRMHRASSNRFDPCFFCARLIDQNVLSCSFVSDSRVSGVCARNNGAWDVSK